MRREGQNRREGVSELREEEPYGRESGSPPAPPPIACEEVGPALTQALATSLTVQGGGTIRGARAVRSNRHINAYYVAAEIDGPGLESAGDVGLWATNNLTDPDLLYSVDNVAREFSSLGDGRSTQYAFG